MYVCVAGVKNEQNVIHISEIDYNSVLGVLGVLRVLGVLGVLGVYFRCVAKIFQLLCWKMGRPLRGHLAGLICRLLLLLSVGLPVANAPDVLQPCGLLYYP